VFARWLDGDLSATCPDGESATAVVDRFGAALEYVADLHRGEPALVVSHGGATALSLPRLCRNAGTELARAHWVPNCAVADVVIDADGWLLRSWPGSGDPSAAEPDPPAG
jgi:broad specificity phosphatase PhoE